MRSNAATRFSSNPATELNRYRALEERGCEIRAPVKLISRQVLCQAVSRHCRVQRNEATGYNLNEAIKGFLGRRGPKELSLETTLARLRAYRERDPRFQSAIAELVESEAALDDPLEGELIEGKVIDGDLAPAGPAQSRIRNLLDA
jgi:hypothetical protein